MNSKALLIAIAAFAVTTTGAHAYGGAILSRAGLNEKQVAAVEEARTLRAVGKFTEARDKLVEAGITEEDLRSVHKVANEARLAIYGAVVHKDYEAFKDAVIGSPLADLITSKVDFEQFCEAHELHTTGEREAAKEIMDELGFGLGVLQHHQIPSIIELSQEQREALRVAKQSNDRATIQAIFDEAGYEPYHQQYKRR